MSDPHFNDDRFVEREVVERPVEREVVVERPVRTRSYTERRAVGGGMGSNVPALLLAAILAVFIVVLVFGYLL